MVVVVEVVDDENEEVDMEDDDRGGEVPMPFMLPLLPGVCGVAGMPGVQGVWGPICGNKGKENNQ